MDISEFSWQLNFNITRLDCLYFHFVNSYVLQHCVLGILNELCELYALRQNFNHNRNF